MENEKKGYETPEVIKVEFDASDRITSSGCAAEFGFASIGNPKCLN